jgi:ligand-binding SRPBCC domain-containing protein
MGIQSRQYCIKLITISSHKTMSTIHRLKSIQKIPASPDVTWKFFSDPRNLFVITPPELNLKVTNEVESETYAGQVFTYTVRPMLGIPIEWMTEITHIENGRRFVDEQRKGPYALWHHQHYFKAIEGGVEMTDIVHYRLPLGFIGNLFHKPVVKGKLIEIFTYRFHKVNEIFGPWPGQQVIIEIDKK